MTEVYDLDRGAHFRLLTLMTHYKKPLDFSEKKMEEAKTILHRWCLIAEPYVNSSPPLEILECFCQDLNMPAAIALMHGYRKDKEGQKLFASMKFLGFFEGWGGSMPSEWKTLPEDQLADIHPKFTS